MEENCKFPKGVGKEGAGLTLEMQTEWPELSVICENLNSRELSKSLLAGIKCVLVCCREEASAFASSGIVTWISPVPGASRSTPSSLWTGGTISGESARTVATWVPRMSTLQNHLRSWFS